MVVVVVRERNIGDAFFLKSWIFGTCKGVLFVVGVDTDAQVVLVKHVALGVLFVYKEHKLRLFVSRIVAWNKTIGAHI